jgi:fumarate hydratase class II
LSGNFELNVMMPLIAHNLSQSIRLLATGVNNFSRRCTEGLKADRERCEEMIDKSLALATALAPEIGYDEAARIAKKAYDQRKTIRQVLEEESRFSREEIDRLLDPRSMITPAKMSRTRS